MNKINTCLKFQQVAEKNTSVDISNFGPSSSGMESEPKDTIIKEEELPPLVIEERLELKTAM
jgi:hypothetical protein